MAPYQVVTIAIRLFAIWLAIYVARVGPAFYIDTRKYNDTVVLAFGAAVAVAAVGLIIVLWFFPRTIARALLPGVSTAKPVASSPNDWLAVGCSLLGLWLLSLAVPGLVRYLIVLYLTQRQSEEISFDGGVHATAIYYALQICIGLWLIFGARGLKRLLEWARHAGPE